MSPLVRRLASPSGFLLVVLGLLFPFLIGSCSDLQPAGVPPEQRQAWRVTYTGADLLTGGAPEVEIADYASRGRLRNLSDADMVRYLGHPPTPLSPQVLAWLALSLLVIGAALTATRRRQWKTWTAAGLSIAVAAALLKATLLARDQATDAVAGVLSRMGSLPDQPAPPVREWEYYPAVHDMFRFGYGFWITVGILAALAVLHTAQALVSGVRGRTRSSGDPT